MVAILISAWIPSFPINDADDFSYATRDEVWTSIKHYHLKTTLLCSVPTPSKYSPCNADAHYSWGILPREAKQQTEVP